LRSSGWLENLRLLPLLALALVISCREA